LRFHHPRGRESTLWLAWWLPALETVGAVLLGYAIAYLHTQAFEPLTALTVVCVTVLVWILPNAAVFNKQRAKFAEAPEPQEK
jgi:peptidoglycan/LPS O-acetylase OafA/YrhL